MKKEYSGPRYERIGDLKFEIQTRTLCMHCWAAVSHYLDYKGDWDVPADLKMALNALGGLFFVADNEFEQFYSARAASLTRAETAVATQRSESTEINLDTVTAYLESKFPDRESATEVSELVQELKAGGYNDMGQVDRDIDRATQALAKYENSVQFRQNARSKKNYFARTGAARISLSLVSDDFLQTDTDLRVLQKAWWTGSDAGISRVAIGSQALRLYYVVRALAANETNEAQMNEMDAGNG
jgi:putative GTP pyrophosphokinase